METRHHADRVIERTHASNDLSPLTASWRRSALRHGLDPAAGVRDCRLTGPELAARREAMGHFLTVAAKPVDELYRLVSGSGCAVLLTDADGILLDRRASAADAGVFDGWALAPGADWSEAAQGTNGVGTCLAEGRGVIIHRDQHFLSANTGMSCIDAPIHGPDGQIIAALDVSSARADATEAMNALIAAMVGQSARAIEAAWFRAAFPGARIVMAGDGVEALVAVDRDDLAIGATRAARRMLGLPRTGALKPRPLSDLLAEAQGRDAEPGGFDRAERAAVIRALARAEGNVTAAARALGIGRATLYRRMARLGISPAQAASRN
ncbi:GAF domain-containing protein [Paracoccus sp. Z118]|uniref:GAF domain-containing protein n=1 Tax=Paracoccus sp. Z118 TaxID=2851017 RepID=UPI001C2BBB32|nr:GAF domain-containing protein [Paracoccus sp. Z118]MBV0890917.1 GAF domain-containing protein [Paracoccus sp. Z118]